MSAKSNANKEKYSKKFKKLNKIIKKNKALIHHITNNVTINDCANITLNWGALPVMASAPEETVQMVESASALVLNLGTISSKELEAMLKAGRRANELAIPVILDPVGVGATDFRTEAAQKILTELQIDLIKGNKGEISFLAGKEAQLRGVESIGEYDDIEKTAVELAARQKTVVVVSSKRDLVTDGSQSAKINQGHYLMGELVGSGCMLASTLGVFAAAAANSELSLFEAARIAVYYYSLAGEKVAEKAKTPVKFKSEFMDEIYLY